jgi:hypothetical protein
MASWTSPRATRPAFSWREMDKHVALFTLKMFPISGRKVWQRIMRAVMGVLTFTVAAHAFAAEAPAARTPIGIWIDPAALSSLPASGPAWERIRRAADESTEAPDLSNRNDPTNVAVMAKALVYVRTGDERYRTEVIDACMTAIGTEAGSRTLALGRELAAYVIAADLVGLPPDKDSLFSEWLRQTLTEDLSGRTLRSTHEDRANNWGTHAGASRMAVAVYLGDERELENAARVFAGYLGDRSAYAGFKFGDDLSWQADSARPVAINPRGAEKSGYSIDGVLPEEQRRAGGFTWPPPHENYIYEGLQGAVAQAVILDRAGYKDVWTWSDSALLRAFEWLQEVADFPAEGDDTWQPHIVNYFYGTSFPAPVPSRPGKNVGWTDWTHPPGETPGQN